MKTLLTAAALTLVLTVPGFADPMKLDDTVEMFFEAAKQRPDFQTAHICRTATSCQTVATATREPDLDGHIGRDYFFKLDNQDHKIWCFQSLNGANTHTRLCQTSDAAGPNGSRLWTEAYVRSVNTWKEIPTNPKAPACASLQMSEYEIDDAYADCVVKGIEADAAPRPTTRRSATPMKRRTPTGRASRLRPRLRSRLSGRRSRLTPASQVAHRSA